MPDVLMLLSRLEQLEQHVLVLNQWLPQALQACQEVLAADALTLYRQVPLGLGLWATTTSHEDTVITLTVTAQQALAQSSPLPDVASNRWWCRLQRHDDLLGLLEVIGAGLASETIQEVAAILATWLENQLLHITLQDQLRVLDDLNRCTTYEEVAQALAKVMLTERGQFLSIGLFERDATGAVSKIYTTVTANRQAVYSVWEELPFDSAAALADFVAWTDTSDLNITELHQVKASGQQPKLVAWLEKFKLYSVCQLPLRSGGITYGTLNINDTRHNISLSAIKRRTYRQLAAQTSTVLENRGLVRQLQDSLNEAQNLLSLVTALVQAPNLESLLRITHQHVGQTATRTTYQEMSYDEHGRLNGVIVRWHITKEGAVAVNTPLHEMIPAEQWDALRDYWQKLGKNLEVIPDFHAPDVVMPIAPLLRSMGIGGSISIPLWDDDHRLGQVNIIWDTPQVFDERLLRLIETVQSQLVIVLQNQRLLQAAQDNVARSAQQVRRLSLLNDLVSLSDQEINETELLTRAAAILMEVAQADHCGISLLQPGGLASKVVAEHPLTGVVGQLIDVEGDISQLVHDQERAVMVADVATDTRIKPNNRRLLTELGIHSILFLPMMDLEGKVLGTVGLDMYASATFDDEIVSLMQTMVRQLSVALQKNRLFASSQRQATQMQQIVLLGQSIQATTDNAEILGQLLESGAEVLPYDYLAVYLYDRAEERLRQVARAWQSEKRVNLRGDLVQAAINNLVMTAWQTRQLIQANDSATLTNWVHPLKHELQTLIAFPISARGGLLGVLELGALQAYAYSGLDVVVLRQMVNQVGVALSNAESYLQSQKLAKNKILANEISAQLQQQIEIENMLQVTLNELGRALGAKRGRIRLATQLPDEPKG